VSPTIRGRVGATGADRFPQSGCPKRLRGELARASARRGQMHIQTHLQIFNPKAASSHKCALLARMIDSAALHEKTARAATRAPGRHAGRHAAPLRGRMVAADFRETSRPGRGCRLNVVCARMGWTDDDPQGRWGENGTSARQLGRKRILAPRMLNRRPKTVLRSAL